MEKILLLWTLYKEEAMDGGGVGVGVEGGKLLIEERKKSAASVA